MSNVYRCTQSGQTPYITLPTQRGCNISMICAIDVGSFLSLKIEMGAFNSDRMVEWCNQSLLPILNGERKVIVMDNASFHHSDAVVNCIQLDGSAAYFLPPNSPQINLMEKFLALVKRRVRSIFPRPQTSDDLKKHVEEIMQEYSNYNFCNFYQRMREWTEKGLSLSSFEGYPLQVKHKQDWGQGFILLLPQTAALPESDAGSGVIKPASSFVIQNRQTSCSMWCPMYRACC